MVWQFLAAPREAKAATEAMERMLSLTIMSIEKGVFDRRGVAK